MIESTRPLYPEERETALSPKNCLSWNGNIMPLVFKKVSRLWESITLSSLDLWNNPHVLLRTNLNKNHAVLEMLVFSLEHAKSAPVSLYVFDTSSGWDYDIDKTIMSRLVAILINTPTRWKRIVMNKISVDWSTVAARSVGDFLILESLTLDSCPKTPQSALRMLDGPHACARSTFAVLTLGYRSTCVPRAAASW